MYCQRTSPEKHTEVKSCPVQFVRKVFKLSSIFIISTLVHVSFCASLAYALDPGWKMVSAPPVSPDEARLILAESPRLVSTSHQFGGVATSETEATPEIVELARGLKHDPKLIFDYVRNHIDYVPTFGSVNGATATLLAGRGNDFDQASLFIALMRASGYTANYIIGDPQYPYFVLDDWLGVAQSEVTQVLSAGGIPYADLGITVAILRVWAKANINGTNYVFDPAFKFHTTTTGIDLAQAMEYDQADFLAAAGGTFGADYVQNMNESNIRSTLQTYSTNMVNHIKNNKPNASVQKIIGGRKILPEDLAEYPTKLPWCFPPGSETKRIEIPDEYRHKLTIQHEGINHTFATYEIAGKRVSIFYTGAGSAPDLKVDGTTVATGNATTLGSTYDLTLSVDHPYAAFEGTYADQTDTYKLTSGYSYLIACDFEGVSKDLIKARNTILTESRLSGEPEQSDAVLGEALNIMGLTWLHELKLSENLLARLAGVVFVNHHTVGIIAQERGYYVDVKLNYVSARSVDGIAENSKAWFFASAGVMSALEHGILEQLQGSDKPGASTVKLLQISNANGKKTFLCRQH